MLVAFRKVNYRYVFVSFLDWMYTERCQQISRNQRTSEQLYQLGVSSSSVPCLYTKHITLCHLNCKYYYVTKLKISSKNSNHPITSFKKTSVLRVSIICYRVVIPAGQSKLIAVLIL